MKIHRTAAAFAAGLACGCLLTAALSTSAQTQQGQRSTVPVDQLRVFADVFGAIRVNYVEPVDDKKAIANCIDGLVSGLDDRSQFYDAAAFRELQVSSPQSGIGGIGLELGMEDGLAKVVSAIEGTPSSRAGLRSGDMLSRIDDQPVKGKTLSDVVKLLRGKPGTDVRLTVLRGGERPPLEISVRREIIRINPVRAAMVSDLAYVRVSAFQESAPQRLAAELTRLWGEGHSPKGVILDLRNNPGGLLNAAVGSSAIFLPEGTPIGATDGRIDDSKRRFAAQAKDFLRGSERDFREGLPPQLASVPVAVLVNRGSAAGSEFLAGALQDHKRAVVVGEKTYGRGSVQTIFPLAEGRALKLTTAYWLRPSGRKVEGAGVDPDVAVEGASAPLDAPDPAKDAALARAVAALKR